MITVFKQNLFECSAILQLCPNSNIFNIFVLFSLLLLSRHDFPEVLRNILCVIYTVYNECLVGVGGEKLKLEHLIAHLLGNVKGTLIDTSSISLLD